MANSAPVGVTPKTTSNSNANTYNTSTQTTTNTTGDIGFTGAQGASLLSDFVKAAQNISTAGFSLSNTINTRALDTVDQLALRGEEQTNNLINATRDFTQRGINASTGQATPLADIPTATTSALSVPGSGVPIWVWIVGGVAILIFVGHAKGK